MNLGIKKINNYLLITVLVTILFSCSISNEIQTYDYRNRNIDNVSDTLVDSSFIRILEPYKAQLDAEMSAVIAHTETSLMSYRPESPLSNLLSDLLYNYGVDYLEQNEPSIKLDFSLMNMGGIRASLPEGEVYVRNAFELMPFENVLVFLELTGSQIIELCNYMASRGGECVSGMQFGMKNNLAFDIKIQGIGVDKNKSYWLAVNDYIAGGGDGMKILTWAKNKIVTDVKVRDIFIEEFKKTEKSNQLLNAKVDGRVYYVD